ncbi:MAG: patatin-like phospholipase family protein [Nocardioides sp.]|uniref:patatin-like phospholipase family protein n=1 Tax=Nocardioides sp. TaxID=35761 RepID=UPI003EFBE3B8
MADTPRVTLALGSGGARGYAHIGIIEVLRERGMEVTGVAGTSMGALIGGLLACDQLDPYADWVRGLTQRDVLRLLDPSLRTPGALRGEKIMAEVRSLVGGTRIEDLRIPFTAVAIDLVTHREVWFQRGRLDSAIRASIALPTVFTPVVLDGRLLVDGGMLNPVPIAPLSALSSDLTIAVDLSGGPRRETPRASGGSPVEGASSDDVRDELADAVGAAALERAAVEEVTASTEKRSSERSEKKVADWRVQMQRRVEELRETEPVRRMAGWFERNEDPAHAAAEENAGSEFGELPAGLGYRDVMTMSYEAMQDVIARYREASYPADITIRVPRDSAHTLEFHRGNELIALGRELAEEALADAGY